MIIWNSAQDVIYNGSTVYGVYANGVKVWPPALQTFSVSCSGKSGASAIAVGMTATRYDEVLYSHVPTTNSFTATDLPSGTRIQLVMITPSGYTANMYRTGITVSSLERETGSGSASSFIVCDGLSGDAQLSAGGYGLNAFTASGSYYPISNSSVYFYNLVPAYMTYATYLAAQPKVSAQLSAQRNMRYFDGSQWGTASLKYFNSSLTYSAVKVTATMTSNLWKGKSTTNSVRMSSRIYNGTSSSQFSATMGASETGSLTKSGSATNTFTGTSFRPTTSASGNSNLYVYQDISTTYSDEYSSLRGYCTAYWTATGIIA